MNEEEIEIVVSDPLSVLPVKNRKYIRNTTEIHFARRNVEVIDNFSDFVNLEVLWLNHNRIKRLENLDENIRIKELYLQYNQISTLKDSSILCFTFLEILNLESNQLSDLDRVLVSLSRCRFLKQLNLSKNPVSQESNYRISVIAAIPGLEVLDNRKVTESERAAARRKRSRKKKTSRKKESNQKLSECTRLLYRDIEKMKIRAQKEENREKQELLERSMEIQRQSHKAPPVMKHKIKEEKESELNFWEMHTLREIHEKHVLGSSQFNAIRVLRDMRDMGRIVKEIDEEDFKSRVGTCTKWSTFENALHDCKIEWGHISVRDARKRCDELFQEAEKSMKRLLSMSNTADENDKIRLKNVASECSQRAEHLNKWIEARTRQRKKNGTEKIDADYMCIYEGRQKYIRKISMMK